MVVRKYDEELKYIEKINDFSWRIKKGFQVKLKNEKNIWPKFNFFLHSQT
jgi:hypothetical protein